MTLHCGKSPTWSGPEFLAFLVYADNRPQRVIGTLIYVQDVFHLGDELGGRLADAPGAYLPRL
jgi:hypothetical protein